MFEISNKLHALVDEFVSNLSSECDSLANNAYFARDTAPENAQAARPSNRTATEVLNGLKRPSGPHAMDHIHREGKTLVEHAKAKLKEGNSTRRDGGRVSQPYELLSSDHSSEDSRPPATKFTKKPLRNQRAMRARNSHTRGSSSQVHIESSVRSPESSHVMNYNYEGETKSEGGRSLDVETHFEKLRWPQNIEVLLDDGMTEKASHDNVAECSKQSQKKKGRSKCNDDILSEEGDESTEEGIGRTTPGAESDVEELPVLPKVPVKRRLANEAGVGQRRTQRGRPKSTSPLMKKPKTPQIDASVITQLYFARRPSNCVSMHTLLFVIIYSICSLLMAHALTLPSGVQLYNARK